MESVVSLISHYGLLAVFVAVFLDEIGLPSASPVVVMTAAAYSTRTPQALIGVLLAALAGGMVADFIWFFAARIHGRRLLTLACRFSATPDGCVRQTNGLYEKYGSLSIVASKFIPGTGVIAIALAGVAEMSIPAFAGFTGLGLLVLHSSFVILGTIFHSAVLQMINTLSELGPYGVAALAVVVSSYLAFRWLRYRAFVQSLKMARVSPDELADLMSSDGSLILVDVRPESLRAAGIIPGALYASPAEAKTSLAHLSRDFEIVIYCSCPNEASAATAAKHLRQFGFKRIRPLAGGYEAWIDAGYSVQLSTSPSAQ